MTATRILIVVLILNLFATLLVFRGMLVLVERVDRLSCPESAGALPETAPPAGLEAPPPEGKADEWSTPEDTAPSAEVASPAAPSDDPSPSPESGTEGMASGPDDIDRIKSEFADQYIDSAWTAEVHQVFQTIASGNPAYTGITQELVECKQQACKVTLAYSDSALFDAFIGQLTESLEGDLAASLYFEEPSTVAGNSRVVLYLVRE